MSSASDKTDPPGTASFGFKRVDKDERQGLVNDVFATVAGRYDLMNDLMSGGLHRLWKDDLVAMLAPPKSARRFDLIDVAGGTGDITAASLRAGGPGCHAVLCDISPEMVAVGRKRLADAGPAGRVAFAIGNAESLPFPDKSFDAYTIAFGIRNVTRIEAALAEAYRVLRTGRALPVPGVLGLRGAAARPAVRLPFLRGDPAAGPARRRLGRVLPVPGGEHPQVSRCRRRSPA